MWHYPNNLKNIVKFHEFVSTHNYNTEKWKSSFPIIPIPEAHQVSHCHLLRLEQMAFSMRKHEFIIAVWTRLRITWRKTSHSCIVVLYRCHFYEKVGYERCCERYKLTENVTGMCTLFENRDCHRHLKTPTHELRPETTESEVLPTIITPEVKEFCRKKLEKKCKPSEIRTKLRERSKYC